MPNGDKKTDLLELQKNGRNGRKLPFCIVCKKYIEDREYALTHNLDENICCPQHQILKYEQKPYYAIMKDFANLIRILKNKFKIKN